MEMICVAAAFRAPEPYPEIRVEGRNLRYARAMLSNMGGGTSEMSAASLYLYDQLVCAGEEALAQTFHEVAMVELHHLEIFGALAVQLGGEPRLWSVQRGRRVWWSPEYNQYNRMMGPLLQAAVRAEEASIRIYENQARWIGDENVRANLRRILADERCHLELFRQRWQEHMDRRR
ncbi:manganese catalase family protein [Pseudoflavonifractor sp. DSM 107456]|uniref:Manganese catalase family protein n=2 Tax=Pseudoflavonifractor TaxID=1017280 RepID=A0ABR9RC60_9FIRM|nr:MULTISPECIES: ferritin family protein [Eubacteriales]MBC5730872.1 manganese catalase family protein [Pseudoflavonifractor hominis]MBE5056280.1 manganese catalase family protein [Pseudoflavonifractor gallinarum]MBS5135239.1 manganese catalase family protein [Oscillospiraceae bacterium]MBT9683318.1 rubrerythrin family protein [Pseudoflavonifractor sp. MCC625]